MCQQAKDCQWIDIGKNAKKLIPQSRVQAAQSVIARMKAFAFQPVCADDSVPIQNKVIQYLRGGWREPDDPVTVFEFRHRGQNGWTSGRLLRGGQDTCSRPDRYKPGGPCRAKTVGQYAV